MQARHLAQRRRHGESNQRAQDVGEDDSRPGNLDRRARSQQKTGADRAADRDHGHLSCAELVAELGRFLLHEVDERRVARHRALAAATVSLD